MSLFVDDEHTSSAWQKSWALIWPNYEYLDKLSKKGLTPVLGGYDLAAIESGEADLVEPGESEGFRFVFGLVKAKPDLPEQIKDILGDDSFKDLMQSLHPDATFDAAKSEVSIPSTETRLYIGLHDEKFWPGELDYPRAFMCEELNVQTTAVIFYSDPDKSVHKCVEGDLMIVFNEGFAAILPDGAGAAEKEAWSVFKPMNN